MGGLCAFFDFQSCPPVSIQDEQIRKTLNVIRVILQNNAFRKIFLDSPDQLGLKSTFENIHTPPFVWIV